MRREEERKKNVRDRKSWIVNKKKRSRRSFRSK